MKVYVIIPAAGLGTRMSATTSPATHSAAHGTPAAKQFLELRGIPILIHTLRAFRAVAAVARIHVAVRANEIERVQAQVTESGLEKIATVVEGGDTRQASVRAALQSLQAQDDDIVLVHDAVRPLIDAATIERTVEAVLKHGAAIVAVPAIDTIKQVERTADGAIIGTTIPRERIVLAQTPQGFRAGILRRIFAEAERDGFLGTDEASLAERAGVSVAVVLGSPRNFKITQPGDLELAEFYLQRSHP